MKRDAPDEFFVGWEREAPPGLARVARRSGLALVAACALVALAVAASQAPVPDGLHEYGHLRTFEGVVTGAALPLLVPDQGADALLLVGAGKRRAPEALTSLAGRRVRFRGTLIRRDLSVAEVTEPSTIEDLGEAPAPPASRPVGEVTLTGELVDTKCWLGVMRPATGKVHRACAVRCLSGGVPPGLLLRGEDGALETVVLAGRDGGALDIDPQLAARVLRIQGELELRQGVPTLRVASWVLADVNPTESPS